MKIKILQWNILYKEKAENIIRALKKFDADIICLQELTTYSEHNKFDAAKTIAKKLKLHYYFHQTSSKSQSAGEFKAMGNGIFSKYPISKNIFKDVFKSKDPGISSRGYVESTISVANKKINIGTTHLCFIPFFKINPHQEDAENLLKIIKTKKKNYILTGDLNATPKSYTIKSIIKHLKHAGPVYSKPTFTTKPFDYKGMKEDKLRWRLDYVFTTPDVKVISSKILKTPYSDHLPILTTIKI